MKKLTLILLFLIALKAFSQDANADKISGVSVFIHSTPVRDYTVIATGTVVFSFTGNEIINRPVKKAKDAGADGVIIYPERRKFDAIKFK